MFQDIVDPSLSGEYLGASDTLFTAVFILLCFALLVLRIVALWEIFEKADEPGWAAVIPIYSTVVLYRITWGSGWYCLLLLIPFVSVVIKIITCVKLASVFGRGAAFAIGLVFVEIVFLCILAFSSESRTKRSKQKEVFRRETYYTTYNEREEEYHRPYANYGSATRREWTPPPWAFAAVAIVVILVSVVLPRPTREELNASITPYDLQTTMNQQTGDYFFTARVNPEHTMADCEATLVIFDATGATIYTKANHYTILPANKETHIEFIVYHDQLPATPARCEIRAYGKYYGPIKENQFIQHPFLFA